MLQSPLFYIEALADEQQSLFLQNYKKEFMTIQIFKSCRVENQNTLNDLEGKHWIRMTKSWFVLDPPARRSKRAHPATFPEELASRFVVFFTKELQWVFDPFAGCGSTLHAAKSNNRNSVGIELYPEYVNLAEERLKNVQNDAQAIIIQGDARRLKESIRRRKLPQFNFCITSPPYWNQLKRSTERQKARLSRHLKTVYGNDTKDLGQIDNYHVFLKQLESIFNSVYDVMATRSYLVVITNNVYANGRIWPLAFDTFDMLSKKWTPKDEMIWCQDDKRLFPFGMFHSYIGNRSHHYCLVFRK